MSVLSMIQGHCRLHALAVPSSVIGSTDTQAIQLYQCLQEILNQMVLESKFNVTTQECVFSCTPGEDQGALATLCPNGYSSAIFETFYDRTRRMALIGPLTEQEWQELKALPIAGSPYKFRIKGDHLLLNPVPSTPLSDIAFEYNSSWYAKSAVGTLKAAFTADDDVTVFPETIVSLGLRFYWKQIKGLPYQADEKRFWDLFNNYIAKDKVKRRINVGEASPNVQPGIFV